MKTKIHKLKINKNRRRILMKKYLFGLGAMLVGEVKSG